MFQGFSKAKSANGGSILSSSKFLILPQLPPKNNARFKSGQSWLKNNHLATQDLNPWNSLYVAKCHLIMYFMYVCAMGEFLVVIMLATKPLLQLSYFCLKMNVATGLKWNIRTFWCSRKNTVMLGFDCHAKMITIKICWGTNVFFVKIFKVYYFWPNFGIYCQKNSVKLIKIFSGGRLFKILRGRKGNF